MCKGAKDLNLDFPVFSWVVDSSIPPLNLPGRSTLPTLQMVPYQSVWGSWAIISLQPAARPPYRVHNPAVRTHHGPGSKG